MGAGSPRGPGVARPHAQPRTAAPAARESAANQYQRVTERHRAGAAVHTRAAGKPPAPERSEVAQRQVAARLLVTPTSAAAAGDQVHQGDEQGRADDGPQDRKGAAVDYDGE